MMGARFRIRIKNRRMEWSVAGYTALLGIRLISNPEALNPETFAAALEFLPEPTWGLIFCLVGFVHLAALAINGLAWWTPFVRASSAAVNLMAYAFLVAGVYETDPDAAAIVTYGFVVWCLLIVVFLALRDCFLMRRALDVHRSLP